MNYFFTVHFIRSWYPCFGLWIFAKIALDKFKKQTLILDMQKRTRHHEFKMYYHVYTGSAFDRGVQWINTENHDTKHNLINYSTVGRELSQLVSQ